MAQKRPFTDAEPLSSELQYGFVRWNVITGSTAGGLFPSGSARPGVSGTVHSVAMAVSASMGVDYVARIGSGSYKVILTDGWVGVGAIIPQFHYSGVLGDATQGQPGLKPSGSNRTLQARVPGQWQVTGTVGTNFFVVQLQALSASTEAGSVRQHGDIVDAHEPTGFDRAGAIFFLKNTSRR